jgi:hypothetical protein
VRSITDGRSQNILCQEQGSNAVDIRLSPVVRGHESSECMIAFRVVLNLGIGISEGKEAPALNV